MWGELMTLLPNFTGEIVTSVMKHHMGVEVKKWANMHYIINEWPLFRLNGLALSVLYCDT